MSYYDVIINIIIYGNSPILHSRYDDDWTDGHNALLMCLCAHNPIRNLRELFQLLTCRGTFRITKRRSSRIFLRSRGNKSDDCSHRKISLLGLERSSIMPSHSVQPDTSTTKNKGTFIMVGKTSYILTTLLAASVQISCHAFAPSGSPSGNRLGVLAASSDDAAAQVMSEYMAKSHAEKLRAVREVEQKKNSEIEV